MYVSDDLNALVVRAVENEKLAETNASHVFRYVWPSPAKFRIVHQPAASLVKTINHSVGGGRVNACDMNPDFHKVFFGALRSLQKKSPSIRTKISGGELPL